MGILRTDRVSGLGGANAIKGSTKLSSNRLLEVHGAESNEDFRLSNGSFTIEFWAYIADTSNSTFVALFENNPARRSWQFEARSDQALRFEWWTDGSSGSNLTASTGSFLRDRWQHFAVVRNGTALNIYVDGTSVANTTTSDTFYENTIEPLTIGGIFQSGAITQEVTGFISNLRIIKGEAIYTANFTPPISELTVTSNTVVLACQSPGNVFKEATGKTIVATTTSTNDAPPEASHFTPNSPVGFSTTSDVGSQYGSTFNGFGNFATSTYMVPPGGNTRERNRGRGLSMGGATPGISNVITFIEMSSYGQTGDFGDLTHIVNGSPGACSSSTRGIVGGGQSPSSNLNTINFVTIANTANASDFGDLSVARRGIAACSSSTRGLWGGGRSDPSGSNPTDEIDFVTIATLGDASDFGNLSVARRYLGSTSSTTRGFWVGGNSPSASDVIDFITITSTGNAADFGNLTAARSSCEGCSSATRAIVIGGFISPAYVNTIDYFTMASSGNATDFGDSTTVSGDSSPCSNSIRGYRVGGGNDSTQMNSIDFVTFSTTGNAQDFGDLPVVQSEGGGCSDSHGGLS